MSFIGCTVASRRFLGQARVLADSFFEHHPAGRFAVLIPDDPGREREHLLGDRVEVLRPTDVGLDEAEANRMALAYTVKELSCALKVQLSRHVIERGDIAVLLDGDVCVYDDLTPVAELAERESLVLTPHALTPHFTPDRYPPTPGLAPRMVNAVGAEQMMVLAGTYNTGLVALSPDAMPFVDWWGERIARYSLLETSRGLFQEQGWTALAPTLFPCHILREHGWNVSGFHLHDRDIDWDGDKPLIGGNPVRCFHYITFDPAQPGRLTRDDQIRPVWPAPEERPGALRLCADYAERLNAAGHADALADVSPNDRLADGTPIDVNMRTAYREALLEHEAGLDAAPPNPFDDGDSARFLDWLSEPRDGVSRYLLAIQTRLPWVWGSFKDVPGADSERYLAWLPAAVEYGDLDIPERWLPDPAKYKDPAMAALLEHVEAVEAHRRALEDVVESVRRSRSWRFTAPARSLRNVVQRLRRPSAYSPDSYLNEMPRRTR
jgi:hypothetical protein